MKGILQMSRLESDNSHYTGLFTVSQSIIVFPRDNALDLKRNILSTSQLNIEKSQLILNHTKLIWSYLKGHLYEALNTLFTCYSEATGKKIKSLESKEFLFTLFPLVKILYYMNITLIPLFLSTWQNSYPKIKMCTIHRSVEIDSVQQERDQSP